MEERYEAFTQLITQIQRSLRRIKCEEIAAFGLKSAHISCLYYLYKRGALTLGELCAVCSEDKAAVSRSLDYLKSTGYIQQQPTAKKRYRTPLLLTEQGKALGEHIANRIDTLLQRGGAGLEEEQRQLLYESLSLINDNLKTLCNEYGG